MEAGARLLVHGGGQHAAVGGGDGGRQGHALPRGDAGVQRGADPGKGHRGVSVLLGREHAVIPAGDEKERKRHKRLCSTLQCRSGSSCPRSVLHSSEADPASAAGLD